MTDWTDEAKERLELMADDPAHFDHTEEDTRAIRAALGEIERQRERAIRQHGRAEAAEAKFPALEIQARCDRDEIRRLRTGFMAVEAKLAEAIPEDVMMRSQEIAAENEVLRAKLAEARVRLVDMYERIIPEEIAKGCALPETRVKELEAALRLGAEAYVAALPDASTDAMTDLAIERNALRQENERLREALKAYNKLSLVIESAVRERRDRDSREEGNYELLVRVISQARAALRGGGE